MKHSNDVWLETLRIMEELQLNAGKMLYLCAQRARLFSEIGTSCAEPSVRRSFEEHARLTIFVADCWRTEFRIADAQGTEFLRIRQQIKNRAKAAKHNDHYLKDTTLRIRASATFERVPDVPLR